MTTRITPPQSVALNLKAQTAKDCLRQMAHGLLPARLNTSCPDLYPDLSATLHEGRAWFYRGLALLPVIVASNEQPSTAFGRLQGAVNFSTTDEPEMCDLVMVMLLPETPDAQYLQRVSSASRTLRDDGFLDLLRTAKQAEQVYNLFQAQNSARLIAAA